MTVLETAPTGADPSPAAAMQAQQPQADKQKRKSAPKVKTGCLGCKASHVRCDEKQPACGRCQRRKTSCAYPNVMEKKRGGLGGAARTAQYRILLPAPNAARAARLVEPSATFLNPREVQYFDTFRHSVIFQLGYGNNEFWRRTVLRESSRDECIRDAVVAIGALVRAQEEHDQTLTANKGRTPNGKPRLPLCKANLTNSSSHYYHALTHYTRAVGSFRKRVAIASQKNGSSAARAVLIATILLVAFESLQGNTPSADQLGASTLALLQHSIMQGTLSGGASKDNDSPPASRIAGSIDDEGTYDSEVMLVRNTFWSSGLSPSYPKARMVIGQLARTPARGPLPPDHTESMAVFSRLWMRCLILSSLSYVGMIHVIFACRHDTAVDSQTWDNVRREQAIVEKTLKAWKMATEGRITAASARVTALSATGAAGAAGKKDTLNTTKLAAAEHELDTYKEISIAVVGCYLSVCMAFDVSGKTWDKYEAEIEKVVERIESMLGKDKLASPGHKAPSSPTVTAKDSSGMNGCYQLRHYYGGFEGPRLILGHLAQQTCNPALRRRLMTLWRSQLDSRSHWDIQGNYLGSRAVFDAEEAQRDKVTGDLPVEKQYHWISGKWSEDYTEFEVTLLAKAPDENGVQVMKVVAMPALKP